MREIALTKDYVALVDDEDYDRIAFNKWHVLDGHPVHRYAARWIRGTKPRCASRMHHEVLDVDPKWLNKNCLVIDHIDRNGLNNQKENIRIVTRSENAYNSERCDNALGVYWDSYRGKYKAVTLDREKRFVGWFDSIEDAIAIRTERCG